LQAAAFETGLPSTVDSLGALNSSPLVHQDFNVSGEGSGPASVVLGIASLGGGSDGDGLQHVWTASTTMTLNAAKLSTQQDLILGLLSPQYTGTGFDSLTFTVTANASSSPLVLQNVTFATLGDANAYFTDNPVDLGLITGVQSVQFQLMESTSTPGDSYYVSLIFGDATANSGPIPEQATWNGGGSGNNWSDSGNWGNTALAANSALIFAGTTNVSTNNDTTAGTRYASMTFNPSAGPFVLSGNAIALGGDIINNSSNLQSVNIGLALQKNTNFNAAAGDLAIGGDISGAFSVTKTGSHVLTLTGANNYAGPTTVMAGTLIVGSPTGLPSTTAVTINGSSVMQLAPNMGGATITSLTIPSSGALDITNNQLFINYGGGPDPISAIAAYIVSGYNGGTWTGSGIISTSTQSNPNFGIAYADSADPGNPAGLASGQIEIRYTLLGDANLDGAVNGSDFAILASNFNRAVNGWDEGDFNYDGAVNGADFAALAANFNQGVGSSVALVPDTAAVNTFASANGLLTNVPEPCSFALGLSVVGFLSLPRRHRR
jgi:autotransporter-associated beta strand protein